MPYDKAKEDAAKETMDLFYAKHKKPKLKAYKKDLQKNTDTKNYSAEDIQNIVKLQRQVRRNLSRVSFKPVAARGKSYDQEIMLFLGKELKNPKVKYSTNFRKAQELAAALKEGKWDNQTLAIAKNVSKSMTPFLQYLKIFGERRFPAKYLTKKEFQDEPIAVPFSIAFKEQLEKGQSTLTKEEQLVLANVAVEKNELSNEEFIDLVDKNKLYSVLGVSSIKEIEANNDELRDKFIEIASATDMQKIEQEFENLNKMTIPFIKAYEKANALLENMPNSPHLFHAMRAYLSDLISLEQLESVLLRHELAAHFGEMKAIPLIDENTRDFTQEAKKYLRDLFPNRFDDPEIIENFRYNLLALPKSEQILFLGEYPKIPLADHGITTTVLPGRSFFQGVKILAVGALDALRVAIYGPERAAKSRAGLGEFSVKDIEIAVEDHERPRANYFPGTKSTFYVHDTFYSRFFGGPYHDNVHAESQSSIPLNIHNTLTHLKILLRQVAKLEISKEIWELSDRPFFTFLAFLPKETEEKVNPILYSNLYYLSRVGAELKQNEEGLSEIHSATAFAHNVLFLTFALDLTSHPDWYQKRNISQKELKTIEQTNSDSLIKLFDNANALKELIQKDPLDLQIIKLAFYSHFVSLNTDMTNEITKKLLDTVEKGVNEGAIKIYKQRANNMLKISYLDPKEQNYIANTQINDFITQLESGLKQETAPVLGKT